MAQDLEGVKASFKIYKSKIKKEDNFSTSMITRREVNAMIYDVVKRCEELAKYTVELEKELEYTKRLLHDVFSIDEDGEFDEIWDIV